MEEKIHAREDRVDPNDVILELNFVPQWARKAPGENHYGRMEDTERERPPRRDDRLSPRRDDRPRRPRPDRPERGDRPERPERGERLGRIERPERLDERTRPPREEFKELPLSVSFLPEQNRLASLVRQIHHSRRAYPLMDLANLLVQDTEGHLVKIEVAKNAPAGFALFQCKCCKAVAASEETMAQHLMAKHLSGFYEKEEIETDPPTGSFPGVARCTKSGILLGPPNHHSYAEKLSELHQSRFAHLSLEEYKRGIEIVRDEALIAQWKDESRKRTVYRRKSDPTAEPVDLRKAELDFAKEIPGLYEPVHRAVVAASVARTLEDRDIIHAIRQVWQKESRFPLSMSYSMRAAFRHMHLHVFKAGKINFVTHIKPNPVKPEQTVENIAEVLVFLREHPGSSRQHLLEVLHPSIDPNTQAARDALQPLSWLIERGHIIEFFNGTLAVPLGRRQR